MEEGKQPARLVISLAGTIDADTSIILCTQFRRQMTSASTTQAYACMTTYNMTGPRNEGADKSCVSGFQQSIIVNSPSSCTCETAVHGCHIPV